MALNEIMPEQEAPAREAYPNRFKPGQSGNPGGRPKKTAAELKAVEELKRLTPEAVKVVAGILANEKASFYARLQAAEIIFNRAMGRPETYLKVDNAEKSVQASVARLQALFDAGDEEEAAAAADVQTSYEDADAEVKTDTEEVRADAG